VAGTVLHAAWVTDNTMQSPERETFSLWQQFSAEPHRMLFLAGATQILLTLAWWLVELTTRATGFLSPATALPAAWAHAFLMVYGVFPFFIFGFLFTVYPRWLRGKAIGHRAYVPVFALMFGGILLFTAGLVLDRRIVALALMLFLAGWAGALISLLRVYARARERGPHERLLNLALAAGLLSIAVFLAAVLTGSTPLFALARELGLWLFLVPVVFLVSHRMIPFFSQSALMNYIMVRPAWGPSLMAVCVIAHAGFELGGLPQWRFLADLPLAVAALHHSYVWQFHRSFHSRLLAMLHIAFLWLGIGMGLYAAQSLVLLATGTDTLGRAPLHALGIGFLTSMIVAMASRVTLGHSGRALSADTLTWAVLLGVNASAVLRIAGEFLPPVASWLNLLAALVWLAALLPWVLRYLPMYLQPRAEHPPG
jgi:uncharacterized protein involved in response to NO